MCEDDKDGQQHSAVGRDALETTGGDSGRRGRRRSGRQAACTLLRAGPSPHRRQSGVAIEFYGLLAAARRRAGHEARRCLGAARAQWRWRLGTYRSWYWSMASRMIRSASSRPRNSSTTTTLFSFFL